ncbi:MAG: hypothetical protein IAE99_06775 [Rhodothermales bacterium]|nr:hypothetical protein [Rhodothermales bacterium]MCA0269104.1 hypothetical protein [Bacteroidota bacterium]
MHLRFAVAAALVFATPAVAQDLRLAGTYALDASASDDIRAAVQTTVARVNPILRGYVRSRLRTANPPIPNVAIVFSGNAVTITTGADTRRNVIDGPGVRARDNDGKAYTTTVTVHGPHLIQRFVADDGTRTNTFSLDAQGRLVMNVRLESNRLPTPLVYNQIYQRR